jgi:outer membrane immunogenic protein
MKNVLLLSAAVLGSSIGMSLAADIAPNETAPWSGVHASLIGGYSQIGVDGNQDDSPVQYPDDGVSAGMAVGVGLGYQHDLGDIVLGVDGDISALTNSEQLTMKDTVEADYDWFATARATAGFDLGGTLIYGTGGLAVLGADYSGGGDTQQQEFYGWTAGAGIEHMASDLVSVKLEGLYADFGSEQFGLSDTDTTIDNDMWVVRGGISLHF